MRNSIIRRIIGIAAAIMISTTGVIYASAACVTGTQAIVCTNGCENTSLYNQITDKNITCGKNNTVYVNGKACQTAGGTTAQKSNCENGTCQGGNTCPSGTCPNSSTAEVTTGNTTQSQNTTPTQSSVSDMERQVVQLVNEVRANNGLPALTLNEELSKVARVKADDMATNGYFSHTSPTYGSPFDMMKSFGISYTTAGENIAMGQTTAQEVMDGWMNSEGHRANILNASFTQIGVGYSANGNYWVQEFIG